MQSEFGWMQIGEETYENDVIIQVDGTVTKRK